MTNQELGKKLEVIEKSLIAKIVFYTDCQEKKTYIETHTAIFST